MRDFETIKKMFGDCVYGNCIAFGPSGAIEQLEKELQWKSIIVNPDIDSINNVENKIYGVFNNIVHYVYVEKNSSFVTDLILNNKSVMYVIEIENPNNNITNNLTNNLTNYLKSMNYSHTNLFNNSLFLHPDMKDKKIVNSFDFFDTIAHRYYVSENSNIAITSKKSNIYDFIKIRKQAEHNAVSLKHIYEKMNSDLYEEEFNLELQNLFINKNNFDKLKPNDIIISDTYYDRTEFKKILDSFQINNNFYCSRSGKRSGLMFEELKKEYLIICHIGDNPSSDGMASLHGINNYVSDFGKLNMIEKILISLNLSNITFLMRKIRLLFTNKSSDIIEAGQLTVITNLLIYKLVLNYCDKNKIKNILLSMRDCCILYKFFEKFCSDIKYTKFYTSRKAYLGNSQQFREYYTSLITPDSAIIDMNGTGKSVMEFLLKNNYSKPKILYICKFKDFDKEKQIDCIYDNNANIIDVLEYINYDVWGSCIDYNNADPVLNDIEYDVTTIKHIHNFVDEWLTNANNSDIMNNINVLSNDEIINILFKFIVLFKSLDYYREITYTHDTCNNIFEPKIYRLFQDVPEQTTDRELYGRFTLKNSKIFNINTFNNAFNTTIDNVADIIKHYENCMDASPAKNMLTHIANKYNSDKGDEYLCAHNYTKWYEEIIEKYDDIIKNRKINLLEIGLNRTNQNDIPSLKLWNDYFNKNINIYGFDICTDFLKFNGKYDNIKIYAGDQGDHNDLAQLKENKYLIIINDGSHMSKHQQISFKNLWPQVESGGVYIIEDLHYQPMIDIKKNDTKELFLSWAKNDYKTTDYIDSCETTAIIKDISKIEFYNSESKNKAWTHDSLLNAFVVIYKK
jgi:hypothetical protein